MRFWRLILCREERKRRKARHAIPEFFDKFPIFNQEFFKESAWLSELLFLWAWAIDWPSTDGLLRAYQSITLTCSKEEWSSDSLSLLNEMIKKKNSEDGFFLYKKLISHLNSFFFIFHLICPVEGFSSFFLYPVGLSQETIIWAHSKIKKKEKENRFLHRTFPTAGIITPFFYFIILFS